MDAYKRWVRRNRDYVHSLESLANGLTWLLPERFSESEIGPEAGFVKLCYYFLGYNHCYQRTYNRNDSKSKGFSFPRASLIPLFIVYFCSEGLGNIG